ncbi:hypothetical protein Pcinc_000453 [Petrolisthes cinctipes]|uniref:Integrase catalytic domain-containing protein n=1 Tax=Petrolisthes cinctipes TaxID=88211 RepID=A0AAE1L4U0_PETCI|nr:hypothetical protein Pcinc_000453 [Petrolisthes cinctipes]
MRVWWEREEKEETQRSNNSVLEYEAACRERFLEDGLFYLKVNDELCKAYGIKRSVTSAYHPQTNGLAERTNRTLKTRLAKLCGNKLSDWPNYIEKVAYSMRTQIQ